MSQQILHRGDGLALFRPCHHNRPVIKRVFRLTLRAAQGFIDSIFTLMDVPLRCPNYTRVCKRVKSVNDPTRE